MKQSSYTYMAVFHKEKDGYSVCFPQLDGCLTEGDDFQSALRMAQEAMSLHLYGMEQDGEEMDRLLNQPLPEAGACLPAKRREARTVPWTE